jgi:hypothetical protein
MQNEPGHTLDVETLIPIPSAPPVGIHSAQQHPIRQVEIEEVEDEDVAGRRDKCLSMLRCPSQGARKGAHTVEMARSKGDVEGYQR